MSASHSGLDLKNYLSPEQKQLAEDTYQTAVQPLRKELFDNTIPRFSEAMAQRGTAFGGLSQDALKKQVLEPLVYQEGQIAGNIATNLGQTAMDQAFRTAELAKQQEFQGSESSKDRMLQETLLSKQQGFAGEQSLLDRAQQEKILNTQQTFAGGESSKDRALQEALLGKQQVFASGEAEKERSLQQWLTTNQTAENRLMSGLNLINSGQLNGTAKAQVLNTLFGPGADKTYQTAGAAAIQQAASAAGITPAEYSKVMSALTSGQIQDMFTDTRQYLNADEEKEMSNKLGIEHFVKIADGKWVNPNYGKDFIDANGNPTINPAYINSPEKATQFQLQLANLQANAQIKAAEAGKSGGLFG